MNYTLGNKRLGVPYIGSDYSRSRAVYCDPTDTPESLDEYGRVVRLTKPIFVASQIDTIQDIIQIGLRKPVVPDTDGTEKDTDYDLINQSTLFAHFVQKDYIYDEDANPEEAEPLAIGVYRGVKGIQSLVMAIGFDFSGDTELVMDADKYSTLMALQPFQAKGNPSYDVDNQPYYLIRIDPVDGEIIVSDDGLYFADTDLETINFIMDSPATNALTCKSLAEASDAVKADVETYLLETATTVNGNNMVLAFTNLGFSHEDLVSTNNATFYQNLRELLHKKLSFIFDPQVVLDRVMLSNIKDSDEYDSPGLPYPKVDDFGELTGGYQAYQAISADVDIRLILCDDYNGTAIVQFYNEDLSFEENAEDDWHYGYGTQYGALVTKNCSVMDTSGTPTSEQLSYWVSPQPNETWAYLGEYSLDDDKPEKVILDAGVSVIHGSIGLVYNAEAERRRKLFLTHQDSTYHVWSTEVNSEISSLNIQLSEIQDEYDEKKEVIDNYEDTVETLTGQVTSLTEQKTQLTADVAEAQETYDDLSEEVTTLTTQKSTLTTDVSTLTTQKTTLTSDVTTLTSQKTSLTSDVSTLTSQKTTLTSDVTDLTAEKTTLTAEVADLQDLIDSLADAEERVAEIQEEVDELTTQKSTLTTQVASLTSQKTELDEYMETNEPLRTELQEEITTLSQQLESLESQVATARVTLINLTADKMATQYQITQLEARITTLEGSIADLESQIATAESDLADVEDSITAKEAEYDALIAEKQAQYDNLMDELEPIAAEIDELREDKADLVADIAALTTQNATLSDQVAAATAQLTSINAEVSSKTTQLGTVTSQLATAQSSLTSAQSSLASVSAQLETAQASATALTTQIQTLRAEQESIESDIVDKTAEYFDVLSDIDAAETSLNALQSQYEDLLNGNLDEELESLEEAITAATEQLAEATAAYESKAADLDALDAELDTLDESLETIMGEIATAAAEKETLTAQVTSLTTQQTTLSNSVTTLNSTIAELTNRVSNYTSQLSDADVAIAEKQAAVAAAEAARVKINAENYDLAKECTAKRFCPWASATILCGHVDTIDYGDN